MNGDPSHVVDPEEAARIAIAPGNMNPIRESRFQAEFPAGLGNWQLEQQGSAVIARCNNDNRVLFFTRDSFIYLSENYGELSQTDLSEVLELGEIDEEYYYQHTPWRFMEVDGLLHLMRRRLEVILNPNQSAFDISLNGEAPRRVRSHQSAVVGIVSFNRPPVTNANASESFPSHFGDWEFERIGHDIVVRNTKDNRTLALGPHEFHYSDTESTVQIPSKIRRGGANDRLLCPVQ